jgi:hypothetical protein
MSLAHVNSSECSRVEPLETRRLLSVFTVVNTADAGAGSLRQALLDSNASPGADSIRFEIPGADVHTIQPASFLPVASEPLVIDGYTQSGSSPNTNPPGTTPNAVQTIRIDGSLLVGYGRFGLKLNGGNSTVRGVSIFGVSTAARFAGDNNVFEGNNASGTVQFDNGVHHRVGGLTPDAVNVMTSLAMLGSDSVIEGNLAATIGISGGGNLIGGRTAAARNVIGPAFKGGLNLYSSGNRVEGNYIGTDVTGTVRNHNRRAGVYIEGDNNIVGGTDPAARNIISGNERGVYIFDGSNNVIQGNWIGPDATGQATLFQPDGVTITSYYEGADGNIIGGTEPGAGNVIAGNGGGVSLFLGTTHTLVQGNLIGVLPDGVTPAGNITDGVFVASSAADNTIGGTTPGSGNVIAYSTGANAPGVIVASNSVITQRIAILGNRIFSNAGLGIDLSADQNLAPDGVTANDNLDADSGANTLQNFPVLTSATTRSGATTVTGSLNSRPSSTYRIEFFSSPPDASGAPAEGSRFLGAISVTTNANGDAAFKATLPTGVSPGELITATATDSTNDTSEFSQGVAATKGTFITPSLHVLQTFAARSPTRESLLDRLSDDPEALI